MLWPPVDLRLDAGFVQRPLQLAADAPYKLLAICFLLLDRALDLLVRGRVEIAETQILQLRLDAPDPQPVGDRRIVVHRLPRRAPPLVLLLPAQRAHIVQPVGQLDDQYAQVFDAGHHHLTQRLDLLVGHRRVRLAAFLLDLFELGHAVDKLGDGRAKIGANVVDAEFGIFCDIMEQSGRYGLRIHAQFGQDLRHGNGMDHIRLAALAPHVAVRVAAQQVSAQDYVPVFRLEALRQRAPERFDRLSFFRRRVDFDIGRIVGGWQWLEPAQNSPQRRSDFTVNRGRNPGATHRGIHCTVRSWSRGIADRRT